MSNGELKHYGVPGMKWGVRRTKSEIGSDRLSRDTKKLANYKDLAKETSSGLREASKIANIANSGRKLSKSQKKTLDSMSDQELRAKINRMSMEQQYASLSPSAKARGLSAVGSFLEVAGSVAAIGSSAVGIALMMRQMKG